MGTDLKGQRRLTSDEQAKESDDCACHLPLILCAAYVELSTSVGEWFKKPLRSLVADLLLSPQAAARGYFNAPSMQKFVREHFDGVRDRQKQLWALVNFELWCQHGK